MQMQQQATLNFDATPSAAHRAPVASRFAVDRTDVHRPSVINTEDYLVLGIVYAGQWVDTVEIAAHNKNVREVIENHMRHTGGKYSGHAHGGNCMVCGNVHAASLATCYHYPSNTYIRVGETCAEKIDLQCTEAFRSLTALVGRVRARTIRAKRDQRRRAEKIERAREELVAAGLGSLAEWWESVPEAKRGVPCGNLMQSDGWHREALIADDLIRELRYWGRLSEGQWELLKRIADRAMLDPDEVQRREEEARAAAADCPKGRVEISGRVVSSKPHQNAYGVTVKIIVADDRGFKVWGSTPSMTPRDAAEIVPNAKPGDRIAFTATVDPSPEDAKFGFFKRPVKARFID